MFKLNKGKGTWAISAITLLSTAGNIRQFLPRLLGLKERILSPKQENARKKIKTIVLLLDMAQKNEESSRVLVRHLII